MGASTASSGGLNVMSILILVVAAAVLALLVARILRRPRLFVIAFIGFVIIGFVLMMIFGVSVVKTDNAGTRAPAVSQSEQLDSGDTDTLEDDKGPASPEPTEIPDEY